MPFNNCNSDTVKRTGSGKCYIQLAVTGGGGEGDGRYIPAQLNVCP